MTKYSGPSMPTPPEKPYPVVNVEWEPTSQGVVLGVGSHYSRLPLLSVRELRDDMEEASYLADGYEKVECEAQDIQPHDRIRLMGSTYTVLNLLSGSLKETVIQFEPHQWTEVPYEITVDNDQMVTVWRPVE